MQHLLELIEILSPRRLKAAGATGFPDAPSRALYGLLSSGTVSNEVMLRKAFGEKHPQESFERAVGNLRRYLHKMLFVVDLNQPQYQLRQKAYFECHRNWAAVKILVGKNARISAVELAVDLLKLSRKYDFSDVSLDIARTLRLQYGSVYGDVKKYAYYSAMEVELEQIVQAENRAERLYTDLAILSVNNRGLKRDLSVKAREYFAQVSEALEQYETYKMHLCGRLIEVMIYSSINDYEGMEQVCTRAIQFFERKKYVANVPLQAFYYQAMMCYIQLRDYPHGKAIAQKGIALLEEGTFNWFKYQELLVILAFHTRSYGDGFEVLKKVVQHRKFGALPERSRQYWKIIEAYHYYLIELGKIKLNSEDHILSRFRIARFANDTPFFSKDRRGVNIPILIFQIVFLLLQKKETEVELRIEAIARYSTRYLVKDDTFRSNCFIKMLMVLPQTGFHRVATMRNTEKYLKLLKEKPLDFVNQAHEVEIIPYEDLWEMVLGTL